MKGPVQRSLHCRCGNRKILAIGFCSTCYTLKRQDDEHFGGLREAVLEHDGKQHGKPGDFRADRALNPACP